MSLFYLRHVGNMWFVKFDYGYNMKVCCFCALGERERERSEASEPTALMLEPATFG